MPALPDRASLVLCRGALLLLCALLSLLPPATAAPAPLAFGHQAWTTEDGLPQNSVHGILQTSDGYLWLATEDGLARFDGLSFTVFRHDDLPQLPSDDISCLAQDRRGTMWIGTTDGLLRYAGHQFSPVTLERGPGPASVLALAEADDGSMLVLTTAGLMRVTDGHATPVPGAPASVDSLTQAPDGSAWLTAGRRLLRYSRGSLDDHGMLPAPPLGLEVGTRGTIWSRSSTAVSALALRAPGAWSPSRVLPVASPTISLSDPSGALWIGTRRGLFLATAVGTAAPTKIETIGDRAVLSLARDREGDLWVGTEADGLHILRSQKVASLPQLTDHLVTSLAQTSDGTVWIGTRDDGLRSRSPGLDVTALPSALTGQLVLALAAGAHGELWVGTLEGLDRLDHGAIRRYSSADGLPDDVIRSLLVDDDGTVWIGTRRGLVHWRGVDGAPFDLVEGLPSSLIGAMLRSRHPAAAGGAAPLWVATLDGLSRIDSTAGHLSVHSESLGSGSAPSVVTSLSEDTAGTLWIGTQSHGLAAITPSGTHILPHTGLPQTVNSLVADAGHLWIGTRTGIFRVAISDLQPCLDHAECSPPLARFGYGDGMTTEETTGVGHPAALLTTAGALWFATARGVAILDPRSLRDNSVVPPVVIERFLVDNRPQPIAPGVSLSLPFSHSSLTVDYAGLSFAAPSRVRYRYRLEGFDAQWTEAGARRTAYYTNLPPGTYRLRVQAANSDGLWNRTGASLPFTILPPFYRRLWFYALLVILLAAVAYAVYYLRVRRLRSEFDAVLAERNRIAREIHDTLAQNFVGITIQLQVAEQLLATRDIDATAAQLQGTRTLAQEGLHEARQSIWELRASVSGDSLPTRISRAAERAAHEGLVPEVTIGGIYRPLAPTLEKEVLRIAGEALANVTRHANATAVHVDLRYEADRLLLAVVDNGRGFESEAVATAGDHFGLQGMRERAAGIAASLSIVSSPGAGTAVRLSVPLSRTERRTA